MGKRKREERHVRKHTDSDETKAHDDDVRIHACLVFGHTCTTVFIKMKNK